MKLLILVFLFFNQLYSQDFHESFEPENDSIIFWEKSRKLRWSDFKSKERRLNMGAAESAVGIRLKSSPSYIEDYKCSFLAYFKQYKSWTNSDSDYLLKHEQLHFDIAELFARKMRKEVYNLKIKKSKLSRFDCKRIYCSLNIEKSAYQDKFDLETNYSREPKKQKKWGKKITEELERLKTYSLDHR